MISLIIIKGHGQNPYRSGKVLAIPLQKIKALALVIPQKDYHHLSIDVHIFAINKSVPSPADNQGFFWLACANFKAVVSQASQ